MTDPSELAERARDLGYEMDAHRAVISALAAQRQAVIYQMSRFWRPVRIAEVLGLTQARVSQLIKRGRENEQTGGAADT